MRVGKGRRGLSGARYEETCMSQHSRAATLTPIITVALKHASFGFKTKEYVKQYGLNSLGSCCAFVHNVSAQNMHLVHLKIAGKLVSM